MPTVTDGVGSFKTLTQFVTNDTGNTASPAIALGQSSVKPAAITAQHVVLQLVYAGSGVGTRNIFIETSRDGGSTWFDNPDYNYTVTAADTRRLFVRGLIGGETHIRVRVKEASGEDGTMDIKYRLGLRKFPNA